MMQPQREPQRGAAAGAAAEAPAEAAAGAEAGAPQAAPVPQFEREEAPPPTGWSRVRRVRELYVGPMSWIMGFCVLGPLIFLCPCGALRPALSPATTATRDTAHARARLRGSACYWP